MSSSIFSSFGHVICVLYKYNFNDSTVKKKKKIKSLGSKMWVEPTQVWLISTGSLGWSG